MASCTFECAQLPGGHGPDPRAAAHPRLSAFCCSLNHDHLPRSGDRNRLAVYDIAGRPWTSARPPSASLIASSSSSRVRPDPVSGWSRPARNAATSPEGDPPRLVFALILSRDPFVHHPAILSGCTLLASPAPFRPALGSMHPPRRANIAHAIALSRPPASGRYLRPRRILYDVPPTFLTR